MRPILFRCIPMISEDGGAICPILYCYVEIGEKRIHVISSGVYTVLNGKNYVKITLIHDIKLKLKKIEMQMVNVTFLTLKQRQDPRSCQSHQPYFDFKP